MAYHSDILHIENATPELIERNADEFTRLRTLLDALMPSVDKAKATDWQSAQRDQYDARLGDVAGLVTGLADGFWRARIALLRYADGMADARSRLSWGLDGETALAALLRDLRIRAETGRGGGSDLPSQAVYNMEGEPLRRWETLTAEYGFSEMVRRLGHNPEEIRRNGDVMYQQCATAFDDALGTEAAARATCLAELASAHAALPDFRGGDFADGAELLAWVPDLRTEAEQAALGPLTHLTGTGVKSDGFPDSGTCTVPPELQRIRDLLRGLPPGYSAQHHEWFGGWTEHDHRQFVTENSTLLIAAAHEYGLPPDMLAGIAWLESGGKPYFADDTAELWDKLGAPEQRDSTSYGPMAVQIRRAAEVLGYDPANLNDAQRDQIRDALKDPAQNIFIAAKYLADLKAESEFADVPASEMTPEQYRELAARYNGGPYWEEEHPQAYGDSFDEVRDKAAGALN